MPTEAETRITKKAALDYLRELERRLWSDEVVDEVAELPFKQRMEFHSARVTFGNLITHLNSALMRDIGDDLQAQAQELKKGIDKLSVSLGKLENAVEWAKTVNGITSAIAKVVKIF